MGVFSSDKSWTNQAKNSGHSGNPENRWTLWPSVCAPKRSSIIGNRKSWGKQANNAAAERKENRGKKPARPLVQHVEDLKKIQARQRTVDRSASRAADTANAAFKELEKAIKKGNPGAIRRAQNKAKVAQKASLKAQRARGRR